MQKHKIRWQRDCRTTGEKKSFIQNKRLFYANFEIHKQTAGKSQISEIKQVENFKPYK